MPRQALLDRLTAKIRVAPNGCWLWTGSLQSKGYGQISFAGKWKLAHRVVFEACGIPIPSGLSLDHLCRTPKCVNPAHLEPVTHQENMRRSARAGFGNAGKTHCPQGHPYEGANPVTSKDGRHRGCRICKVNRDRQRRRPSHANERAS